MNFVRFSYQIDASTLRASLLFLLLHISIVSHLCAESSSTPFTSRSRIITLQQNINDLRSILPERIGEAELQLRFENISKRLNLKLDYFELADIENTDFLDEYTGYTEHQTFSVGLKGSINNLVEFFSRLGKQAIIIDVGNLRLSSSNADPCDQLSVTSTFEAHTMSFSEVTPTEQDVQVITKPDEEELLAVLEARLKKTVLLVQKQKTEQKNPAAILETLYEEAREIVCIKQLQIKDDQLEINGTSNSRLSIRTFVSHLKKAPFVRTILSDTERQKRRYHFNLVAEIDCTKEPFVPKFLRDAE